MIVLSENSRAIYFFPVTMNDAKGDFLAHCELAEDGGTLITYRHRWYAKGEEQDPWSDKDVKHWHAMTTPEAPQIAIPKFEKATRLMAAIAGSSEFYALVRGSMSYDEFFDTFRAMPWVSFKPAPMPEPTVTRH